MKVDLQIYNHIYASHTQTGVGAEGELFGGGGGQIGEEVLGQTQTVP